jgi:hypothetical protein
MRACRAVVCEHACVIDAEDERTAIGQFDGVAGVANLDGTPKVKRCSGSRGGRLDGCQSRIGMIRWASSAVNR